MRTQFTAEKDEEKKEEKEEEEGGRRRRREEGREEEMESRERKAIQVEGYVVQFSWVEPTGFYLNFLGEKKSSHSSLFERVELVCSFIEKKVTERLSKFTSTPTRNLCYNGGSHL